MAKGKPISKGTHFAVIQTGGKQYRVSEGQTLTIEKNPREAKKKKKKQPHNKVS